jgi:hypothetical protein
MNIMIKKLTFVLIMNLLITSNLILSAEFNIGERINITSSLLNEEREIQILLPEFYRSNRKAVYHVIYILDGDFTFHEVSGMLDYYGK